MDKPKCEQNGKVVTFLAIIYVIFEPSDIRNLSNIGLMIDYEYPSLPKEDIINSMFRIVAHLLFILVFQIEMSAVCYNKEHEKL